MSRPTLDLIDGHALAYRMFFALPAQGFRTKAGEPTNAVYGFARTLLDLLDEKPAYLAVTFDQGLSGRGELFAEYKGTREKMPDDLRMQLDRIRDLVTAFNIPILELAGYEADDVMGSVAPQAEAQGTDVLLITGDRDILQLITPHTTVQLPGKRGEKELWDADRFREEYGLEPPQLVDLKGLMGDNSDNIPGVKGIGAKTAAKLIQEYGSVAGVYEHLDAIKGSLHQKLEEGRDLALLSRELARIHRDVPVKLDLAACVAHDYRYADVEQVFRALEFRTLIDRLPRPTAGRVVVSGGAQQMSMFEMAEEQAAEHGPVVPYEIVDDVSKLAALVERLESAQAIAWDIEGTGLDRMALDLVGICAGSRRRAGLLRAGGAYRDQCVDRSRRAARSHRRAFAAPTADGDGDHAHCGPL